MSSPHYLFGVFSHFVGPALSYPNHYMKDNHNKYILTFIHICFMDIYIVIIIT